MCKMLRIKRLSQKGLSKYLWTAQMSLLHTKKDQKYWNLTYDELTLMVPANKMCDFVVTSCVW